MATILIVDDLAANRDVLVSILRHQGHRLLEAPDGSKGLEAVRAEHPDLVITDVLMPVMDGYELVRQLRLDPETRTIPVIFYTAHYGEREARALAVSSGVAHVLTKPVEPQEVLDVVGLALAGRLADGVEAPLPSEFDREHLRLVTDKLSEHSEDLRAANVRLRALVNIGLELASEQDPDRLLDSVCVAARELFGATYVTLGIVDRDDKRLRRYVSSGVETAHWIKAGDSIPGVLRTVIGERRTIRGDNTGSDPTALDLPAAHPHIHAYLIAPVASPSHVYGWLCLVNNEGLVFTDEDYQLLTALSGQLGRVYENGYFHAVARKRAQELEHQIAERERAESALRLERDRAERYLNAADVILLALDLDGRITLINRYGCTLLGRPADELLGQSWIDTCLPPAHRQELKRKFDDLVRGDLSVVENAVLTRSGEERLIEWHNTLLRDDAGETIGTLSCGTDITERSRAIAALRTAEERMRFALENAEVGIWDADYRTGQVEWSEIVEAQFGLQPGTFSGTFEAFMEHVHPDDRASLLEVIVKAMKSGDDFSMQHRAIWPDGQVRWMTGAGRILLDDAGQPVRGVGITLDVTARHMLEEQYQQAQKMEAIGRLAGGVAHDFNNLLSAILGYCELLLAEVSPTDPRHNDITEIHKAGTQAAGLTRQLLAFSRKQIIEPRLIDMSEVVRDMRAMLGRLIGEDVAVEVRLQPDIPLVRADRGQLEQIVMNLAVNARDAMPNGGLLIIETARVELDEDYAATHISAKPGSHVRLAVTDTGMGMSQDVQARLFEPFFTTKEPGKGTGLGLATIHGIVTRSGGTVQVYSEIGKGTVFSVYLPVADPGEAAGEAQTQRLTEPLPEGSQTILVVEDMKGLRELARRLLERQGYTVLLAANAEEAMELFEQAGAIDVLLTDVVMPGASGPELTRRLVEQRPNLKVIYMSGYTEEAIVHHGVLKPGIAFLNKPFTAEMLGRKIREVINTQPGR